MRAYVLRVGKSDKMRGLPSTLSLFRNVIQNLIKQDHKMLHSINHLPLNLLKPATKLINSIIQELECLILCITCH